MPYMDHAGASLPSSSQMEEIHKLSIDMTLANPHSHHATSRRTKQIVDNARERVLHHFNTSSDEYSIIFTQNTTHSMRIVAESFRFASKKSNNCEFSSSLSKINGPAYAYLYDSHTSLVGIREIMKSKIDNIVCLPSLPSSFSSLPRVENSLFGLTAMSNFCGKKYDLSIVKELQDKGWSMLIDAAALVSSSELDLSQYKPHFIAFSFYKMFGFPTGLGGLIVRKDAENLLEKSFFSGGTISMMLPTESVWIPRERFEERFEDGTINYYSIAVLQKGFEDLQKYGGMSSIQDKSYNLARKAYKMIKGKYHWNGKPLAVIYCDNDDFGNKETQGPIVNFNLKTDEGEYIGYSEVEKMCDLFGLEVRIGCFCNVGACQKYLNLTTEILRQNRLSGKECGDSMDIINGRPTGSVRVSFGRQSKQEDIDVLETMLDYCFLGQHPPQPIEHPLSIDLFRPSISHLTVFPIKSCSGIQLRKSQLTITGLQYDRHFMIINNDVTLSQKKHPQLCRIQTQINEIDSTLTLISSKTKSSTTVGLEPQEGNTESNIVCEKRVSTGDCGNIVASFLDSILDMTGCRLRRVVADSERSLSNDSPYLLINEASVNVLATAINLPLDEVIYRFRANLVIRGLPPFQEDSANRIWIDEVEFEIVSRCLRCEMICVDQETGEKRPDLIIALRDFRYKEKMSFGLYLKEVGESKKVLHVGSTVIFE